MWDIKLVKYAEYYTNPIDFLYIYIFLKVLLLNTKSAIFKG
jgi:hypothetical protein